ncbi:MAG: potassium/proton antiporter [Thermoguttaceae bacterium]|jgi:cell volume regulation protein A|nr:potassium/proton antiporter [Thermoguttaceae bacterium]
MTLIDTLILLTGLLLLLGIASSKLSARLGLPVLVLFLVLGMLAGEEGIGGIAFENYELAYGVGTLALAIILFDGGLGTPVTAIRAVWRPSLLLATIGVLGTALLTGFAAAWILRLSLLEGLLLGSIVGSTDAAAVFSILRHGGITLPKRLAATLEVESASNDPMAIFLTIGCIELLTGRMVFGPGLLGLFVSQMLLGALVGVALGYLAVRAVNRINLDAAGLYPVLVTAFGLLAFGLASWIGGSGFLAVYLAGIVIGNSRLVLQRGIRLFHDASAWLAQIVMFVVLGLLSFPSRLVAVSLQGLLIGLVLILIARPVSVALTLPWFRFNRRELLFLSWVGLKGAVPITLATFPLLAGIPQAQLLFDVVFFVVVLSALVQGWTLPVLARWLGLERPAEPASPVRLEIMSLRDVEGEVVDYAVGANSRAAGRLVRELALPEGAVIALIVRQHQVIPPHGKTRIEAGDHAILVLRREILPLVTQVFSETEGDRDAIPRLTEFPLRPNVRVGELEEAYDIEMKVRPEWTLAEALRSRLEPQQVQPGSMVQFGPIALHVRSVSAGGEIEQVGMVILPTEDIA